MPNSEIMDKSVEVINRILGESAFIFTDPLEESEQPEIESWVAHGVYITFSGFKTGSVTLWGGDDFLCSTAANMLGIDEDDERAREKGIDALKEVLNIIVGNLITSIYGSEQVFDLSIPEVLSSEKLAEVYDPQEVIWLEAEGNPILFVMNI